MSEALDRLEELRVGVYFCIDSPGILDTIIDGTRRVPDGQSLYDPLYVLPREYLDFRIMLHPPASGDVVWVEGAYYEVSRRVWQVLTGQGNGYTGGKWMTMMKRDVQAVVLLRPLSRKSHSRKALGMEG